MEYNTQNFDIEINESTVKQIVNEILEASTQPIKSASKLSEEQLKNAAKQFLAVLKYEQKNIRTLQNVLEEKKKWESAFNKMNKDVNDLSSLKRSQVEYQAFNNKIKAMKKDILMQQSVKNIYQAGLAFQDLMNKAIGQNPVLVLHASSTKETASFEIPIKEAFDKKLIYVDISSDGKITMRFRAPISRLNQYAASIDSEINKITNERDIQDKQRLDEAYREVIRRFNKYKLQMPKNRVVSVVLWKKQNQWMKMLPSSKGDIAEAYNAYYLMDLDGYMGNDLESNIDIFMSFVANIDNARGRLLGDVRKLNIDGTSTEYAIKSAGASVESLDQIIEMAQAVLNASNGLVRDTLIKMKTHDEEVKVPRNKIEKLAKDELVYSVAQGVKTAINVFNKDVAI